MVTGELSPDRPKGLPTVITGVPPLVDRIRELRRLNLWLEEAAKGRPRIVLMDGDAGIGKTRLLQEVRAAGQRSGMQICFGRCYEDLSLPYLPFFESLLPQFEQAPPETQQALGDGLETIRRLLHRVGGTAAATHPSLSGQGDYEKLQLFVAVGQASVKLAQSRPMLFVLDDLHWADRLSLDLFDHLVFTVADVAAREAVPLLVIGTYRPVKAETRLARLIERIRREEICRVMTLEGLDEPDVQDLIAALGLARPSHQLTAAVSGATHGNPLFVQEVLHHLLREHAIQEQGGYLVTPIASSDLRLPDQVSAAILSRSQEITEACRSVLKLAAVLGDSFSLQTLAAVTGIGDDELLTLLEEGMRHRLLRTEGEIFQFAHPIIRHVYYQDSSPPRRQRLHKQIAESLQRLFADRLDEHLLEIAHHLVRAGSTVPADVVADHARRAADDAFRVFAWSEAAYYYEAALTAGEASGQLSLPDQAALHYWAGLAHFSNQDVGPCLHHYEKAIEAYRRAGDVPGLGRALMEKTRTQFTLAAVPLGIVADVKPLEEILTVLGEREPALRGHIAAVMSEAYRSGRQPEQARRRAEQALEIGRQLGDDYLCGYASFALALAHINDLQVREALEGWENALVYARRGEDFIRESWTLHRIPLALTLLGRFADAERTALKACESTRTSHDWSNFSLGLSHLASVAVGLGDFDLAEQHAYETMLMVVRSRYPWGGLRSLLALACARTLRGSWQEAEDSLDVLVAPGRVFGDPGPVVRAFGRVFRNLIRAHAGRIEPSLEALADDLMSVAGRDTYSLAPLCALAEVGSVAGMPFIADRPYASLARAAERDIIFSTGWMFSIPRVLGVADAANGRWEAAQQHFERAIETGIKAGAHPELARTYLDYADMLIGRGVSACRDQIIDLLWQAYPLLVELGMAPFAQRAARLAETLGIRLPAAATPHPTYPDELSEREVGVLIRMARGRSDQEIARELVLGQSTVAGHRTNILSKTNIKDQAAARTYTAEKGLEPSTGHEQRVPPVAVPASLGRALRTILVSDIAASNALIKRAGDARAHALLRTHDAIIRECLSAHQGEEITHTGDGIEASFVSASAAVECAVAIQKALARHNREDPGHAIHVRIGINAGEPISTEGRLFGTAVHRAFRICARARAGQILVSDVVHQLVAGKDFVLVSRGRVALKGIERIRLFEVVWTSKT